MWNKVSSPPQLGLLEYLTQPGFEPSRPTSEFLATTEPNDPSAPVGSYIIELVREPVTSNMQYKFEQDTQETFQVITPLM